MIFNLIWLTAFVVGYWVIVVVVQRYTKWPKKAMFKIALLLYLAIIFVGAASGFGWRRTVQSHAGEVSRPGQIEYVETEDANTIEDGRDIQQEAYDSLEEFREGKVP